VSEPSIADFDDDEVTGVDPGDALVAGSDTDVDHQAAGIEPGDPDYVAAADVPEVDDEGGS
jgi:hypothetical protein